MVYGLLHAFVLGILLFSYLFVLQSLLCKVSLRFFCLLKIWVKHLFLLLCLPLKTNDEWYMDCYIYSWRLVVCLSYNHSCVRFPCISFCLLKNWGKHNFLDSRFTL